jgi:hypothetical protein
MATSGVAVRVMVGDRVVVGVSVSVGVGVIVGVDEGSWISVGASVGVEEGGWVGRGVELAGIAVSVGGSVSGTIPAQPVKQRQTTHIHRQFSLMIFTLYDPTPVKLPSDRGIQASPDC